MNWFLDLNNCLLGMCDVMQQQNPPCSHHSEIGTLQTTIDNNTTAMHSKCHVVTSYNEEYPLMCRFIC